MTDKIGQEIEVGSIIAYGHLLDRSAGLRIGKVIKFSETKETRYDGRKMAVYRITVLGIDDDWSFHPIKLNSRKGTLQFPNRTLVLNKDTLPEKYQKLLETVKISP